MNALLVDDDYYVVAALEKKINWKALGIEHIYTAYNVAQAKEILGQCPVQILICDIEMPQGSGLELLAWIREEQYNVQAIFLTNYADFNYAQKAIELQSSDYFLKPIEFDKLTLIIQKAIAKSREQQNYKEAIQEGKLWKINQNKIVEHFWRKLIMAKSFPSVPAAMARTIAEENLSYQMTDKFLPVLVNIFPYEASWGNGDKDLFDYALLNVLSELFDHTSFSVETILEYKDFNWMLVLRWKQSHNADVVEEICSSFILKANRFLRSDVCCTIGISCGLGAVHQIIRQLIRMNVEMVKSRNHTYLLENARQQEATVYTPPDLALLEELLDRDNPDAFLAETSRYLQSFVKDQALSTSVISLFRLDMVQLVYSFLKNKEIEAHKLYAGTKHDQLFNQSLNSIEDLKLYLCYLINTAMDYRDFTEQPKSVVEELKRFIAAHCGEDLTRMSLAEIVYLNPDYLARLFKKETGISLGTYIIQVRTKAAKQMLETTTLSVNIIARKVGYTNYSYFAKVFKQEVGCTPNDFRKNRLKNRDVRASDI